MRILNRNENKKWNLIKLSNNSIVNFAKIRKKYIDINGSLAVQGKKIGFDELHEADIDGFCTLGLPLFDKYQKKAVFYYGYQVYILAGRGKAYYAELIDNNWTIINSKLNWVS